MAYTNSDLSTAQAKLTQKFASGELRAPNNATVLAYLKSTEIMVPSYQELRTREDRATNTYFINRALRSAGSARAHNHTGTHGTSTLFTPTWATASDKFAISLKQGDKNIFSRQEMLMSELYNVQLNLIKDLESKAVNHLFANRTGVNVATVEGTFNATNDVFEVDSSANENRFQQIIDSVLTLNDWSTGHTYFCDTVAFNKLRYQAAQGAQNATNLSFQFLGETYVHSHGLSAKADTLSYTKGFVVAVPDGMIAALPWIPVQNRTGVETKIQSYASIMNPFDGLDYAIHTYSTAADGTSVGGYTQDEITQFEVSIDMSFDSAPLSTADETPLYAFALI